MQHDARTARADRMAYADAAAVEVEPLVRHFAERARQPQMLAAIGRRPPRRETAEHLRGKCLVDFPVVDVVKPEPVAL